MKLMNDTNPKGQFGDEIRQADRHALQCSRILRTHAVVGVTTKKVDEKTNSVNRVFDCGV